MKNGKKQEGHAGSVGYSQLASLLGPAGIEPASHPEPPDCLSSSKGQDRFLPLDGGGARAGVTPPRPPLSLHPPCPRLRVGFTERQTQLVEIVILDVSKRAWHAPAERVVSKFQRLQAGE